MYLSWEKRDKITITHDLEAYHLNYNFICTYSLKHEYSMV